MSDFFIGTLTPAIVTMLMIVVIGIIIYSFIPLLKTFLKLSLIIKILLFLIVIGGFCVRFYLTPNLHRIYYDEDRYLSYAVTYAQYGKSVGINFAIPHKVIKGDVDPVARLTVPTLNAWGLKLFGSSENNLFIMAKIISSLQIILLFIAAYLLLKNEAVAIISALLFAFLPTPIYWSTSTALDSYFVFFALLSFIAACWYARYSNRLQTLFFIASLTLLVFVRFEALLFLLVLLTTVIVLRKSDNLPVISSADKLFLALFLIVISYRVLLSISVLGQTWCCGDSTPLEAFQGGYFIRNTLPNLFALFNRSEFPFVITLLSLGTLLGSKTQKTLPLTVWILSYFFIYSFYFAGMFFAQNYSGSYGRYFLMLIPPLLILSSMSLQTLYKFYKIAELKLKIVLIILSLFAVGTLAPTIRDYRSMIYLSPFDSLVDEGPRIIHNHLEHVIIPQTPSNSIIIHPLTDLLLLHNRIAIYFGSFLYDSKVQRYVKSELEKGIPVYMFETHTCDAQPLKCKAILHYFKFLPVPLKDPENTGLEIVKLQLKK